LESLSLLKCQYLNVMLLHNRLRLTALIFMTQADEREKSALCMGAVCVCVSILIAGL